MRKFITGAALLLTVSVSLFSCKGKTTEVGKWLVTDMSMPNVTDPAMKTQIADQIKQEQMIMEFKADGTCTTSSKSMPASEAKYKRNGETLEVTDNKTNKTDKMEIKTLTESDMTLSGDAGGQQMTMTLKRQP